MTPDRWEYLKALKPSDGVMAHVSKTFRWALSRPTYLVGNPGVTLDIGRNKAKRIARAKSHRHIGKAPRVSP